MDARDLPLHPTASLFPSMSAVEFTAFRDDVGSNGLREPVWVWRGQVIDGRHRRRVCQELDRPCPCREWDGDEAGLVAFVVSLNMRRRHLDESQRALVAARVATMRRGDNQHTAIAGTSQSQAARLLNVSEDSIGRARKVIANGTPELVQAVESGRVAVSTAADLADGSPVEQVSALTAADERVILAEARRIKLEKRAKRDRERNAARQGSAWPESFRHDGPLRVIHDDCLQVLRGMPDGAVDAVITDPPFSERTHRGHDTVADRAIGDPGYDDADRKVLGYAPWTEADVATYVPELSRVASGWIVIFTDHTLYPCIIKTLVGCGRYVFAPVVYYAPGSRCRLSGDGPSSWTDWIVVARTAAQHRWGTLPGGYTPGEGWRDRQHMGGKPTMLMRSLVRDYSREGDLVLDPFAGSGTTGIAALAENRRAILVEKDAGYAETCRRRAAEAMSTKQEQSPGSASTDPGRSDDEAA